MQNDSQKYFFRALANIWAIVGFAISAFFMNLTHLTISIRQGGRVGHIKNKHI